MVRISITAGGLRFVAETHPAAQDILFERES